MGSPLSTGCVLAERVGGPGTARLQGSLGKSGRRWRVLALSRDEMHLSRLRSLPSARCRGWRAAVGVGLEATGAVAIWEVRKGH